MRLNFLIIFLLALVSAYAADPMATNYTPAQCEGSAMPYPSTIKRVPAPDSLEVVMINHVGRHGSRFIASSRHTTSLLRLLSRADSLGTITPAGRKFRDLCNLIVTRTAGRWGALDSLGMAEQRAIASRLFATFPSILKGNTIKAISSYSPRAIMSMDEFTHQLSRLDNHIEIYTSSGRQNSPLLRPYDSDEAYKEYIASPEWHKVYDDYIDAMITPAIATRLLGADFPLDQAETQDIARSVYSIIAGCSAMSVSVNTTDFLTPAEYNALWSVNNLHHYLTYSASTLSSVVPDMAAGLLIDLINTTDAFIEGEDKATLQLRFGHAETLMPLLALMHVAGCYYMTNYFDTVGQHWRDFYIVPMAANIQLILLRDKKGEYFVRLDLNEVPVPIIPGRGTLYTPWSTAREYFNKCLPLIDQIF